MYSFDSRVRFSETDPNGQLSLPAVINYFQDCSEFQSDSLGTGVDTLGTHAWILNAWQVQFRHFPKRNDVITIATKPYQFKGIEGFRNFLIFDADGNVAINANSIWTYFDLQKQRPCRITDDQYEAYQLEDAYPMECAPRKIAIKDLSENDYETLSSLTVTRSHLDLFGHMNNAQYVTIAYDHLPEDFSYTQMRVEYKKQARLGDVITTKRACLKDRTVLCLENEDKEPYAILEFTDIPL